MKRLLVANIIEEGRWGGPQKRITEVATELQKHDIDTVVILPCANSTRFQKELQRHRVQFELINLTGPKINLGAAVRYLVFFVPDLIRLFRCLRQRPYDLVHVSGGAWQIKGAIAGKLAGIPVVWHLNDSQLPSILVQTFRLLAEKLATAFIVSAERTRMYYLAVPKLSRFSIFSVPAPVDTKNYDPAKSALATRITEYPGLRVVLVANISIVKGIDHFIDAAKLLLDGGGVVYSFLVVGPVYDTQRRYYETLRERVDQLGIGESFHFIGEVEDVHAVLAATDIYVCSSRAESSPMAVWEAMAMERAVVSADVGDVARYVRSGESGYVVPVGDVRALADAIGELAAKPEMRRQFGERARQVVLRNLDIEIIGARTLACYRQVIGRLYGETGGMVLGIDASNIRAGGGVTHLVELLRAADPQSNGFGRVIVWGGSATLGQIEDRPWLQKALDPLLERNLLFRVYWQKFRLKNLVKTSRCSILFVPGGTDLSGCGPVVTMSQNLLPFEWRELRRFGVSWVGLKLLLLKFTQGRTFRKATAVIFLSRYAQDVVKRELGVMSGKDALIPLGISGRFLRMPCPQRSIADYSFEQPLRILYVSIIDMYKHQWHVAEAVAQLRAMGFPVMLDFVGPSYPPALRRLQATLQRVDPVAEFIHYRGAFPHEKLHEIVAAADVNVFASSCENMPNILLEGMASGLPIACSNRGPMPEVLEDAGVYFDPEQPDEIAAAIRTLIESPELRSKKAQAAFERAQQFSWARCSDKTFRLLAEVCRDFHRSLRSLPKRQA